MKFWIDSVKGYVLHEDLYNCWSLGKIIMMMVCFQTDAYKQNITVKIESDIEIDPSEGNSILAGLIPYDPERVKKDLEEQMKRTLILTKAEFCDAADMGIFLAFVAIIIVVVCFVIDYMYLVLFL